MSIRTPCFISSKGGSITCFRGDSGRIYRSCSRDRCVYSGDLHSAKIYLDDLENGPNMLLNKVNNIQHQRKTTLKWDGHGELSSHDMARILDRLSEPTLTECDFACGVNDESSVGFHHPFPHGVPATSWLP